MNTKLVNADKSELDDVLAKCYQSTKVLAKTLFPEKFYLPFSEKIHDKMFELMDDDSIQKVAIEAPRGVGKTSIANLLYPAKSILFREREYIIPVSCSSSSAIEQSENLKKELTSNQNILKLFGNCKSNSWAKEMWEASWDDSPFRTRILPRGAGQQIRGRLFGNTRPDLVIIDDLEDPKNMDSEEQRRKKKEWFFSDLMNSVDKYGAGKHKWRIIFIGSFLHQDSLIANLVEDKNWASARLEICDGNFKSNWPDVISDDEIDEMYQQYVEQDIPEVFFREYRSISKMGKDNTFKRSYFNYYKESELDTKYLESVVIGDPAKTSKMKAADSAVIGVGVDTRNSKIFARRLNLEHFHPDEFYEALFEMCISLNARILAVETTGLKEYISYPIKNEMARNGYSFEFMELTARRGNKRGQGKLDRIASLLPFYRQGQIYHNKSECGPLETQLEAFPYSKKLDAMDAFAYIVEILEEGMRYFEPKLPDESSWEIEREYDDLDYEEGLEQANYKVI